MRITTFTPERCPECGEGRINSITENRQPFSEFGLFKIYERCNADCGYENVIRDDRRVFGPYERYMAFNDLPLRNRTNSSNGTNGFNRENNTLHHDAYACVTNSN